MKCFRCASTRFANVHTLLACWENDMGRVSVPRRIRRIFVPKNNGLTPIGIAASQSWRFYVPHSMFLLQHRAPTFIFAIRTMLGSAAVSLYPDPLAALRINAI